MNTSKSLYAIYKFDFHKAIERSIEAEANGIDGSRYVKTAQQCFASLFDQNSIDKFAKVNKKGESLIFLPNDVMAVSGGVFMWRVNNSQIKDLWKRSGKDSKGIDKYEKLEDESNPYCYVLIDNRPGRCLMAIEKSAAWGSKPDMLRDVMLDNFNRLLAYRFDLEMRIEARMNTKEIWDFVHERLYEHNDYIRNISFTFQNPKKINKTNGLEVRSSRLKAMLKTVEISDALKGFFRMEFDKDTNDKISQKNKDLAEMVRLCGENGYDISITFKDYKVYRINDYVRAYYPLVTDVLRDFRVGSRTINGMIELEEWFDLIGEQTKSYLNESEVPKRRNKAGK